MPKILTGVPSSRKSVLLKADSNSGSSIAVKSTGGIRGAIASFEQRTRPQIQPSLFLLGRSCYALAFLVVVRRTDFRTVPFPTRLAGTDRFRVHRHDSRQRHRRRQRWLDSRRWQRSGGRRNGGQRSAGGRGGRCGRARRGRGLPPGNTEPATIATNRAPITVGAAKFAKRFAPVSSNRRPSVFIVCTPSPSKRVGGRVSAQLQNPDPALSGVPWVIVLKTTQ